MVKQVILLITDGDDRDSASTLETAIRRVQDLDGPVVYCIGLLYGSDDMDRTSRKHSQHVLQTLADQTGGIAYFPRTVDEVDEITQEVARDIRSQYPPSRITRRGPTTSRATVRSRWMRRRRVMASSMCAHAADISPRPAAGRHGRRAADADSQHELVDGQVALGDDLRLAHEIGQRNEAGRNHNQNPDGVNVGKRAGLRLHAGVDVCRGTMEGIGILRAAEARGEGAELRLVLRAGSGDVGGEIGLVD